MQSFHQEPIPSWLAGVSCVLFAAMFVGSLYVIPLAKIAPASQSPSNTASATQNNFRRQKLDRDHPLVIQQRIKGITLTMILVPVYLWIIFSFSGVLPSDSVINWMSEKEFITYFSSRILIRLILLKKIYWTLVALADTDRSFPPTSWPDVAFQPTQDTEPSLYPIVFGRCFILGSIVYDVP